MRLLLATRNAHKLREFAAAAAGASTLDPLPDGLPAPVEDGDTYAANALIKARAAARRHRPRRDRRRLRDRGGGARRRARRPHRPLRRRATRPTPRTSPSSSPRRPPAARLRYVCVIAHVEPGGAEHLFEGTADRHRGGAAARRAAASATTRCSCPTTARATAARWPSCPTPRRTRSPTAAARRARSRSGCGDETASARARAAVSIVSNTALIALKLVAGLITGSVAIITEAIHSSVDLAASYIAFFSVRQAETPADAYAPLRAREVRERGRGRRGRADPRRLGRDRLRRDPQPGRGPELDSLGFGIAVVAFATRRQPRRVSAGCTGRRARRSRPRSRATPRTCGPTRSRRSACSSASRSCSSPARSGSTRSSRSRSPRRSS